MSFLQDTIEYMTLCVCEFYEKNHFLSQFQSQNSYFLYNISTDQSKDDYHLETAGDYVWNTLLVIISYMLIMTFLITQGQSHVLRLNWYSKDPGSCPGGDACFSH